MHEPYNYSLSQNYPNPFNPSTIIEFQISDFGFVSLKVFDILGNEITTLVNEEKPAGSYKIKFSTGSTRLPDGQVHQTLTSGIYFYQLKAGNFIQTKKMLIVK
ncbi:MAG: T9SS type A sorting domain-containing protein [Ignavibacteriaceae bacterium]